MLVGDLIFFEQLGHFFGHDITIILNGDQRDFFSLLGFLFRRGEVRLFWVVSHRIQYTPRKLKKSASFV